MTKQAKPKKSVKVQAKAKPVPRPKAAAKKAVAKPPAAKKPVAKKSAVKKVVAKKSAVKKVVAKKPVAKKPAATVKKSAPKKPAAQQAKAKKIAVKKPAAQQAKAKKSAVKKPVAMKPASKKPVAKKPAAKKPVATKPAPKKAPEKKIAAPAPKAAVAAPAYQPIVERHAAGYYNGVLLCEKPGLIPAKSPYTDRELLNVREMLQTERRHLLEVLRDLDAVTLQGAKENGKSASPGYSIHLAEDASDNVETETSLLVRHEEEEALMQVNVAFERLDHGLFGVCMACGCKIGMPRLKAKPEAHLCIDCKQIYDKRASRR